ncbi:MAG TPA: hypothetical protein VN821_00580 [Candidatus Udaeobacter sp.]|nr:hypothetical protein [Candidatus Udaeobacter sp.]
MLKIASLLLLSFIASVALAPGRAEAAPQILGLMSSNGMPTPLHCRDGLCTGYFASFCLQEAREAPVDGQDYRVAPGGSLVLNATLADGRQLRLPAEGLAVIRVQESYLSVQISLPVAKLEALGVPTRSTSLALEVGPETSILPVEQAGDPDPQSPEEIALATGPLRRLAARTLDRSDEDSDAARWVGLLINALPPEDSAQPVALGALFRHVVASVGEARQASDGLAEAAQIVQMCQTFPASSLAAGFCLADQQHGLVSILNSEFWDEAGGS